MTKLSIITINLNNRDGLRRTIDSVVSQVCKDFEWIIIDGGSTDGSRELIEQYSQYITYWVSEQDTGIYNAMNKGVKEAKGQYLQFLNSGDCLYDANVIADFLKRENTEDVIYGNTLVVDNDLKEISRIAAPSYIRLSFFWVGTLCHQSVFFEKKCFEHFRYNEKYKIASDYGLILKLALNGFSFCKYDRFIAKYNGFGISSCRSSEVEKIQIREDLLPSCIKIDYDEVIRYRNVDLAKMIMEIIKSKRICRNITRVFLYPLYYIFVRKQNKAVDV